MQDIAITGNSNLLSSSCSSCYVVAGIPSLLSQLTDYTRDFAGKPCCFNDVRPYLQQLNSEEQLQVCFSACLVCFPYVVSFVLVHRVFFNNMSHWLRECLGGRFFKFQNKRATIILLQAPDQSRLFWKNWKSMLRGHFLGRWLVY